jgi:protein tyrosine phosphatase (PTP) superfamily phosphohydrolase (DUF442 family)
VLAGVVYLSGNARRRACGTEGVMWIALAVLVCAAADAGADWSKLEVSGCENVLQVTESVYSGGEPHTEEALKALADLGIKTIVSVDGAKPDVETAKKYGLRYIHLPIGYDGFSRERGLQFGRVLTDTEGPVYFHCHHGKHRGPVALAAGMEASGQWQPGEAHAFLKAAGTAAKYTGLYEIIDTFTPPTKGELAAVDVTFPAIADTPPFQEAMALIDRQKDNLSLAEKAGWKTPTDHPDIAPAHEALQIRESFAEVLRLKTEGDRPAGYRDEMTKALDAAVALEEALRASQADAATTAFKALNQSCNACHEQYRD